MNYIYIYAIAVLLWVLLPVFLYILSNCRRNHGNEERRTSNEDSEKNDTNIDRFEVISCGTIIKVRKIYSSSWMLKVHNLRINSDEQNL
jgi:hypothetical protein